MNLNKAKNNREAADVVSFRLEGERKNIIEKVASAEKKNKSEIIRRYIDMGIKNDGYRRNDELLRELIRDVVQEVMKPHVERLASISAKAANIDAASFFLLVYVGRLVLPPSERRLVDEAAENARRLGIEFLKLKKDRDLDDFILGGLKDMQDD